ncbi:MAG: cytochrome C [endosymbiont of Galathealinum brachiosum]|uniref:Cytochrome C n=1 Tax=endosymbiont of Galathealinum brachiosum TaxID=2200906 RepID=A0A370DDR0_9GAMM|nr:MAG: cytochrome C [endosymbiont of Galathealinum brachiosum]
MIKLQFLILLSAILLPITSMALSPQAIEGKNLYPSCHVCHNPEMDPPLGPPMWGVQRRYKNNSLDDEDFIQSMTDFVKAPTLKKALQDKAVKRMGLMPALALPDDMLKKIATYILEETFPPPCAHWKIGVKRSTEQGDLEHAKKDQNKLKRFCN